MQQDDSITTVAELRDDILTRRLGRRSVLKRGIALGLSAPIIASLLAACGGDDDDTTDTESDGGTTSGSGNAGDNTPASDADAEGGDASPATDGETDSGSAAGLTRGQGELLRLLYWQAPTILNPHFYQGDKDAHPARLVLEPLVNLDNDGNPTACLAAEVPSLENGGVAADGLSVTYTLKEGVIWSDGTPLTAEDVKFTWEYASNVDTAATTFATYDVVENVEATDDLTVTITFKNPNPAWYTVFAGAFGGQILPKHILQDFVGTAARDAEFNLKPIGTGPYKVQEFRPGDTVLFEMNENFRDPNKPFFQMIDWKGGGDPTSAARAAVQSGEVDFAWNLQVEKQVVDQMSSEDGPGEIVVVPGTSVEQILVNFADPNEEIDGARAEPTTEHPFFTDKAVRNAFALATDRETIATQLYGASGTATANILVAPTRFASPNTTTEYDIEAARAMLDEAGWTLDGDVRSKDGVELSVLYSTTVNPIRQKTQEINKQTWEDMGAKVELKSIDSSVYFSPDAGNPDTAAHFYADLTMFTNGPTSSYPIDYMAGFKSDEPETDIAQKANQWSGPNYNRWVNEEFNELWQQGRVELDPAVQADLFIAMNDLVVNEYARIALVHRAALRGVSKRLKGNVPSAWDVDVYDIENWYFED